MDQIWADLVRQGEVKVSTQVQKAAVVILWLAMPGNEVANTHSTIFAKAAGLDGKQKWRLILSSSARVTQMTYQTVIGAVVDWLQLQFQFFRDAKSSLAVLLFLLAAAWVDPGRNALQSAEQRC